MTGPTQSDSPCNPRTSPISEWDRGHTLYVLRQAKLGKGVGSINLDSPFSYRASYHVAFRLREEGYIRERVIGSRPVTPYLMQGGFQISDEPIWRGELTEKGEALLRDLEGRSGSARP